MRLFSLAFMSSIWAVSAQAEPTAEEACAFFARNVPVTLERQGFVFEPIEAQPFELRETNLERYAVYARPPITQRFGTANDDGTLNVVGALSALMLCEVDIVERRVLTVSVINGPSAGAPLEIENSTANVPDKTVSGIRPVSVPVGEAVHQGKF